MRLNRSGYRTVRPLGIEFPLVSFVPVPSGRRLATERADAPRRAVGGACGAERITVRRPVRPNEAASTAEDPFPDRRNHVSDAERVKSVCWRGSPDPLQRPRSTGCWEKVSTEPSRGRARFAVVHIDQVEETTLSKGRRAACAETTQHSYCRTERALGRGSCHSRTHRVVRTMLAGGEELHQQGGRLCAALALACGRCVFVCLATIVRNPELQARALRTPGRNHRTPADGSPDSGPKSRTPVRTPGMIRWTPVQNHWSPGC